MKKILPLIAYFFIIYFALSMSIYRFKHVEMTETQLILNTWNALRFK